MVKLLGVEGEEMEDDGSPRDAAEEDPTGVTETSGVGPGVRKNVARDEESPVVGAGVGNGL